MIRKRLKYIAVAICMFGLAYPGSAQEPVSENDIIPGARAIGMGGAQIGGVNDLTAVIHNPAALARMKNIEVQLGLFNTMTKMETSLSSQTAYGVGTGDDSYTGFGTFGIAYPVPTDRGSLVFALALTRAKDFTSTFFMEGVDDDALYYDFNEDGIIREEDDEYWEGETTNEIIESGGINIISLAGAVDVAPNLAVGASIDIWSGHYNLDERYLVNNYETEDSWLDVVSREDDITAWSFKPSVLYFTDNFRLGAFVRFPMTFHIDHEYILDSYGMYQEEYYQLHSYVDPYYDEDHFFADDSVWNKYSYEIKAPLQFGVGFSLGEPGWRSIAVDMIYEDWKEGEDKDFPYYFTDKYRTATSFRIGAEHPLPFAGVVGRIGYYRQPLRFNGPRENYIGAPAIDFENERDWLTLGVSVPLDESFRVDVGYARGYWRVGEGSRFDKETRNQIYASVVYRMPPIY